MNHLWLIDKLLNFLVFFCFNKLFSTQEQNTLSFLSSNSGTDQHEMSFDWIETSFNFSGDFYHVGEKFFVSCALTISSKLIIYYSSNVS